MRNGRGTGFRAYARYNTKCWALAGFLAWPLVALGIVCVPAGIAAEAAWLVVLAVVSKRRAGGRR
jgi:hypothetical protein